MHLNSQWNTGCFFLLILYQIPLFLVVLSTQELLNIRSFFIYGYAIALIAWLYNNNSAWGGDNYRLLTLTNSN